MSRNGILDRITNRLGFGRVPVLNEDGMSSYEIGRAHV